MSIDFKDIKGKYLQVGDILIYDECRFFIITGFDHPSSRYPVRVTEIGKKYSDGMSLKVAELFNRSKLGKLLFRV